ncbi:MAG: universal stress protein [Crocinitomicaceae bacterium]|nr:universal stress protein [Crocinitomicaceae bacterium]
MKLDSTKKNVIVVPFDFTPTTEKALQYALNITESIDQVILLHIVKSASDVENMKAKLTSIIDVLPEDSKLRVSSKIIHGKLSEDINAGAESLKADLIVMGTHGARGMQKIWGSNALKIVSSSHIPFMITQGKETFSSISKIILPFSYAKETLQVAQFAGSIANHYKASIDLIGYRDKDEGLVQNMKINQTVMRRLLTDQGVDYTISSLPGKKSYEKELIEYSNKKGADLIAAAYFNESIFTAIGNSFLQDLIENKFDIPILTVSAMSLGKMNGSLVF